MAGFKYSKFKEALMRVEKERFELLKKDIEQVKIFVEKCLTLCLESNANLTRVKYHGADI